MGYVLIIFFMLIALIIKLILEFFKNFGGILLGILGICLGIYIVYQIYISLFLASEKFKKIKQSIKKNTLECNALNEHIEALKKTNLEFKSFDYGVGILKDNSNYNFKRSQWEKIKKNEFMYQCSLSICKNAQNQPFKYLCKYFNIKTDEETLSRVEEMLNNFLAVEQGKQLLQNERERIFKTISKEIPFLIVTYSKERVIKELGFEKVNLKDIYFPTYTFQYVSSGGNSSAKCDITLNIQNLEKFIYYLAEIIKFRQSIAGQRALMTQKLREKIKKRDNYTCKKCGLSIYKEENLLLEIDHIIPLAKGGITTENNLQTLCWKCNRSKGVKILE